jgi:hypothetical protein
MLLTRLVVVCETSGKPKSSNIQREDDESQPGGENISLQVS